MNHDMTHCADYRKSLCPQHCFRAMLTQELFERKARGELSGMPMTFAHLRWTDECVLGAEAGTSACKFPPRSKTGGTR